MKDKPIIIAAAIIAFSIFALAYVLSRVAAEIAGARQESSGPCATAREPIQTRCPDLRKRLATMRDDPR